MADTSTEKSASSDTGARFGGVDDVGVQVRNDGAEAVLNGTQVGAEISYLGNSVIQFFQQFIASSGASFFLINSASW